MGFSHFAYVVLSLNLSFSECTCATEDCEPSNLLQLQHRCSLTGADCRPTACCVDSGYTCYQKNDYWAGCRPDCSPGQEDPNDPPEFRSPWTCQVVGCSTDSEDCRSTGCCSDERKTCYVKDSSWAGCRESCQAGEENPNDPPEYRTPWSCEVLGVTKIPSTTRRAELSACFRLQKNRK